MLLCQPTEVNNFLFLFFCIRLIETKTMMVDIAIYRKWTFSEIEYLIAKLFYHGDLDIGFYDYFTVLQKVEH